MLTSNTQLLTLRSAYLFKQYLGLCLNNVNYKDYVPNHTHIIKVIAIIHGLRSMNLFVHSIEGFFKML